MIVTSHKYNQALDKADDLQVRLDCTLELSQKCNQLKLIEKEGEIDWFLVDNCCMNSSHQILRLLDDGKLKNYSSLPQNP